MYRVRASASACASDAWQHLYVLLEALYTTTLTEKRIIAGLTVAHIHNAAR